MHLHLGAIKRQSGEGGTAEGLPTRPQPHGTWVICFAVSDGSGGEDGWGGAVTGPYSLSVSSPKWRCVHLSSPILTEFCVFVSLSREIHVKEWLERA